MRSSSGRHAIQARKLCCWRKLRICCARGGGFAVTRLALTILLSTIGVPICLSGLHDSVLLKRFDRTTSFFDGLSNPLFAASLLECARENLGFGFGGNQQDSINVAKKNISGTDAHRSDLNRNAEVDYFVARRRVLSVGSEAECGEAHIK